MKLLKGQFQISSYRPFPAPCMDIFLWSVCPGRRFWRWKQRRTVCILSSTEHVYLISGSYGSSVKMYHFHFTLTVMDPLWANEMSLARHLRCLTNDMLSYECMDPPTWQFYPCHSHYYAGTINKEVKGKQNT